MSHDTLLWDKLSGHFGHDVRIAVYGNADDPADVCLECDDCGEVVLDAELYTISARSGIEPEQPIEKALEDWGAEIKGINTLLGCCELLAGLAEEATELAQAALKMRRTLDKSNPTPMTTSDASRNLNEEFADVLLCAAVLGFDREEIARIIREKAARWSTRLEGDE